MPHDANGNELNVGDRVVIPATITHISEGDTGYCNCGVELAYSMPPDMTKTAFSALNTQQVEKVEAAIKYEDAA